MAINMKWKANADFKGQRKRKRDIKFESLKSTGWQAASMSMDLKSEAFFQRRASWHL